MQRVTVVGGGYGGIAVARQLDDVADVVLVEPKDAFVHATATLRSVVDPSWDDNVFLPYDQLLARGRIVRDRVRSATSTRVRLSAAHDLDTDYLVLATGTTYPFPAKFLEDAAAVARAHLERTRESLVAARDVLLVGAGPVGLELAGEITSAYPHVHVTIVEKEGEILPGGDYLPELRHELVDQLSARGVRFVLDSTLAYLPPSDVGVYHPFTVETRAGEEISGQVWFRCYGSLAATEYVTGDLLAARRHDGTMLVRPTMQVEGFDTVFAIGDIAAVAESRRASAARAHAAVAVENLRALLEGREPTAQYVVPPDLIVLPLGPDGGVSQLRDAAGGAHLLDAKDTSELKGIDLFVGTLRESLGLPRD